MVLSSTTINFAGFDVLALRLTKCVWDAFRSRPRAIRQARVARRRRPQVQSTKECVGDGEAGRTACHSLKMIDSYFESAERSVFISDLPHPDCGRPTLPSFEGVSHHTEDACVQYHGIGHPRLRTVADCLGRHYTCREVIHRAIPRTLSEVNFFGGASHSDRDLGSATSEFSIGGGEHALSSDREDRLGRSKIRRN